MEKTKWIIWSIEHDGWWKTSNNGYTNEIKGAGIYSYEGALNIVDGANYHMTLPKRPKFDKDLNTPYEAMILVTPELEGLIDDKK